MLYGIQIQPLNLCEVMLSSCHLYPYVLYQTIQYASQSMNAVTTKANAAERYKFLLELSGAALNTASLFFLT